MDIKIALGKIEQYWQIIRNLHFHIEQEGQISPEEYALIEKYLKVISLKYKDLVAEEENSENLISEVEVKEDEHLPVVKATSEEVVSINEEQISTTIKEESNFLNEIVEEKIEEIPSVEVKSEPANIEESNPPQFEAVEEEEENEENLSSKIKELIPEIATESPKHNKISSYLEQMLDSPDTVPNTPMFFNVKQEGVKAASLNDRLKEMSSPVEDLNSRIKKATADKISLNDKFEFIKVLFGNNPIEYASAIQQFDTYGPMIWDNVEREFSNKFNWSTKKESVQKLKALVTGK